MISAGTEHAKSQHHYRKKEEKRKKNSRQQRSIHSALKYICHMKHNHAWLQRRNYNGSTLVNSDNNAFTFYLAVCRRYRRGAGGGGCCLQDGDKIPPIWKLFKKLRRWANTLIRDHPKTHNTYMSVWSSLEIWTLLTVCVLVLSTL